MATYTFRFPGRNAGKTVTVFDQSNAQVTSGTTDSDAVLTVSLAYGDYYAVAPDGQYVRGGVDSPQSVESTALSAMFSGRNGKLANYGNAAPLGSRASHPQGLIGTVTEQQSRMYVKVTSPVRTVSLAYFNWYGAGGASETAGAADLKVAAGIEMPDGTFRRVMFRGNTAHTIGPGGWVVSDPISIDHAGPSAASPFFYVRTLVYAYTPGTTTPVAGQIPQGPTSNDTGEGTESGAITDKTTSGTIGSTFGFMYAPIVLGTIPTTKPTIVALGDSIAYGNGDTASYMGWPIRFGRDKNLPVIKVTQGGQQVSGFITPNGHARAITLAEGATHAICAWGANDLGSTAADATKILTIKTNLVTAWRLVKSYVPKVAALTITPRTTSTDSWATTANQTVTASEPARVDINDWIRAGAPINASTFAPVAVGTTGALLAGQAGHPLDRYFDAADAIETARNSGIWRADGGTWTINDGLHGNSKFYQAVADKISADTSGWATTI